MKVEIKNKKLLAFQIIGMLLVVVFAIFLGIISRENAVAFRNNPYAVGSEALVPPVVAGIGFYFLYKLSNKIYKISDKC